MLRAQRRISTFGETEVEIPSNARYTKSRREVRPSDIKLDTCRSMEEPKERHMAVIREWEWEWSKGKTTPTYDT
jgi:hypothetical protein